MRAATTIRRGSIPPATRRPPGRLDTRKNWTSRRGLVIVALSTSATTTGSNLRFHPYGAVSRYDRAGNTGGYIDNPYGLHGGIQVRATGNIKFGARWYSRANGTWAQQDTLNAPLDPTNANRYEYAADDPINNSDPSDHEILSAPGGIAGGIVPRVLALQFVCPTCDRFRYSGCSSNSQGSARASRSFTPEGAWP